MDVGVGLGIGGVVFRWLPRATTVVLLGAGALVGAIVFNNLYWLFFPHP